MYRVLHNYRTQQRIKNNLKDMSHTHLMESRLKAEMVVKPSALWQHRDVRDAVHAQLVFDVDSYSDCCL